CSGYSGLKKESVDITADLINKMSTIRKNVSEVLTNPQHEDFLKLKAVAENYLRDPEVQRIESVYYMTRQVDDEYIAFYRKINTLRKEGLHSDFYAEIAQRMEESNNEYLTDNGLLSLPEFQSLIDKSNPQEEEIAGTDIFEDIKVSADIIAN